MFNTLATGGVTATQVAEIDYILSSQLGRGKRSKTQWSINDGVVDIAGPIKGNDFVSNGRFKVRFGAVTTTLFSVDNVFDLDGAPQHLSGAFDVRSPYLTSLVGGPKSANAYHAEADCLEDLTGAPKTNMLKVVSKGLKSLVGMPERYLIAKADFKFCQAVTNTDGLHWVMFTSLELPSSLTEITETPLAARAIHLAPTGPCKGVAKLFETTSLANFTCGGDLARAAQAFFQLLDEHDEPRIRRLAAEQALIDHDLDAYL